MRHRAALWALTLMFPLGAADGQFFGPPIVPDSFLESSLERTAEAPPASACFVRLTIGLDQSQSLVVRAFGLPPGSYEVTRSGFDGLTTMGSFTVGADGLGKLTPPPPDVDDFHTWFVFANYVDVWHDGELWFSDYLDPQISFVLSDPDVAVWVNGARLVAVGSDLDANGRLLFTSSFGDETAELRVDHLDPGFHILEVDGEPQLYLEADGSGKARVRLEVPVASGTGQLNFESPGKLVRVLDAAGQPELAAIMPFGPGTHTPGKQKFHDLGDGAVDGLSVDLVRPGFLLDDAPPAGWLAWQRDASGAATVSVQLMAPKIGSFWPLDVWVGDTLLGTLVVPPPQAKLPITGSFPVGPEVDLRGQLVAVRQGSQPRLAAIFPQSVPAGLRSYHKGVRKPHHIHLDLLNPGIDLDATGLVDWREHAGSQQLQLVVRDLPAGACDVALDDVVVAPGALVVAVDGGEAQALFSSNGLLGSLPLDFAVHGQLSIRAAGTDTVYLQQSLDP